MVTRDSCTSILIRSAFRRKRKKSDTEQEQQTRERKLNISVRPLTPSVNLSFRMTTDSSTVNRGITAWNKQTRTHSYNMTYIPTGSYFKFDAPCPIYTS